MNRCSTTPDSPPPTITDRTRCPSSSSSSRPPCHRSSHSTSPTRSPTRWIRTHGTTPNKRPLCTTNPLSIRQWRALRKPRRVADGAFATPIMVANSTQRSSVWSGSLSVAWGPGSSSLWGLRLVFFPRLGNARPHDGCLLHDQGGGVLRMRGLDHWRSLEVSASTVLS